MRTRGDDDNSEAKRIDARADTPSHARHRQLLVTMEIEMSVRLAVMGAAALVGVMAIAPATASAGCRGYVQASAEGTFKLPTELLSRARWRSEVQRPLFFGLRVLEQGGGQDHALPQGRSGRQVALRCTRASVRLIRVSPLDARRGAARRDEVPALDEIALRALVEAGMTGGRQVRI